MRQNDTVRWLALDIATACKCRDLFPVLKKIHKPHDSISRQAGYALDDLVDENTAAQLIPIVEGGFTPKQPRPVRVCALRGLVATIWSVARAMPWAKRLVGSVDFLDWYLADQVKPTDVVETLRALSDRKRVFDSLFPLRKVVTRCLILGLDQFDSAEIKSLIAKMLFKEISYYGLQEWHEAGDFGRRVETDPAIRRPLLLEIYRTAFTSESENRWQLAPFFLPDDLVWLMDCASSSNPAERGQYLEMITWLMRPEVVAPNWDDVVSRITTSPALRSLESWFGPCNLRSREVMKVRSEWKERTARQERYRKELAKNKLPPREPLIDKALAAGREGRPEAWVSLSEWIFISDSGTWSSGQPYYDIVASPGWECASEQRRDEMYALARKFLLSLKQELRREPNRSTNFSNAAFSASWLLREELRDPGPLQDAFAKYCVPTVVWGFSSDDDVVSELTALIYPLNRKRGRELLRKKLEFDTMNGEGITLAPRPYLGCWEAELAKIVERFVLGKPRRPETIRSLFVEVAQVDPATIQRIWRELAARYETDSDPGPMAAATELMIELYAEPLWSELYPFLEANPEVARLSILNSAHYGHGYGLKAPLPLIEEHLGKLYLLLYKLFPPSDPEERWPDDGEPRRVGSRHIAARFRDSLRDQLVSRGTQAACDELKVLCRKVGKDDRLWTKKRWLDCVEILRQKKWKPIGISEVSEIAQRRNAYWVQSENNLLVVVIETLDELQRSFSASAGDVIEFWSYKRTGNRISEQKPKSEVDVARQIYSFLRTKLTGPHGAIIHREVAVQWDQRRTDIEVIVAAESRRQWREVAVVIEVKRAWNSRLKADVREQLRDRYLKRTGRRQGIYLVAWFECELWRPRRRALKSRTVEAARKEVATLCRKASTDEYLVSPYVLDCALPG